jgi:hypothetical protein
MPHTIARLYLWLAGYRRITSCHYHKPYTLQCCDLYATPSGLILTFGTLTLAETRESILYRCTNGASGAPQYDLP